MGSELIQYRGYLIACCVTEPQAVILMDGVLGRLLSQQEVFKDERKGFVAKFHDKNLGDLMLKVPRGRNQRRWERFLTFFRPSVALRQLEDMQLLTYLGFKGPVPILAAEKRKWGVVVDSFIIYRYQDGRQGNAGDARLITPELIRLHHMGYTRKDPQPRNFIIQGEDVVFVDFDLKKPWFFPKLKCLMEFCKHLETMPRGIAYRKQLDGSDKLFCLAYVMQYLLSATRRTKQYLKGRYLRCF